MKDLFATIEDWVQKGKPFSIARVIKTWGSSPRPIGSAMIVSEDMEMAGSVSGGCVEGAVIKSALPIIENGNAQKLAFGVTNEDAWAVGLSCGGKIQVFAERFMAFDDRASEKEVWSALKDCLKNNKGCILLTLLEEGENSHTLVFADGTTIGAVISDDLKNQTLQTFAERKTQIIEIGETSYFAQVFARKSQMIIIGAAHITVDLVQLAKMYDFETIVIDPRGIFTNKTQFTIPPDKIFEKYPAEVLSDYTLDAYTYTVVLSHDPKIDDNALHILLKEPVAYIGALGSRRTHEKRVNRLKEAGFSVEQIERVHAPIGVDIKAKKPKEIALSIMGEIIKTQNAFL